MANELPYSRRYIPYQGNRGFVPGARYQSAKSHLTINGREFQPGDLLPPDCLPDEKLSLLFRASYIGPATKGE